MSRGGTLRYIEEINALKEKYAGSIRLLLGTELDRYADIDTSPYDYLIGSVHYIFSEQGLKKHGTILAAHAGGAALGASDAEITASDAELEALVKFEDWCPVDDGAEELRQFALNGFPGSNESSGSESAGDTDEDACKLFADPETRKKRMLDIAELYYDKIGRAHV